ncbi:MAG: hypothetical protein SOR11_10775 [Fusobacterium sp.]|uniref:hypothetical protein n=1 Tax=Fusobacterium sp. TaxID=68766 RepID=UPI002A747326|nr:hypothetical protein [Fusobacterium sp.]MDY3060456.1 hypothetical protein [Fusobacterium sp.]
MLAIFIIGITILLFIILTILASYSNFHKKIIKLEKNELKAFGMFIFLFFSSIKNGKTIEKLLNEKNNENTLVKTLEESINKLASLEDNYDDKNKINIKTSNEETYIFRRDERGTI